MPKEPRKHPAKGQITVRYSPIPTALRPDFQKLESGFEACRLEMMRHSFSKLPWQHFDAQTLKKIHPWDIRRVNLIGFGGSSLGAKAIASALGCIHDEGARLSIIDNLNDSILDGRCSAFSAAPEAHELAVFASKSGETIEVLSLAKIIIDQLQRYKASPRRRCLTMTDDKNSTLGRISQKHGIPIIQTPTGVPGRFSVLSNVGLAPAYWLGAKVNELLSGARQASAASAHMLACHQYLHFKNKRNILVLFNYEENLESFCDWYIQLLAESIGKSPEIGITPTKARGVSDQHSQLQLYLDGPDDKFYIFLKGMDTCGPWKIPGEKYSLGDLFNAEYEGVKQALEKNKRPFMEITWAGMNERTLGELFFFFEMQIAFLGSLFGIDFENQPGVELSKSMTKRMLEKY